MAASFFQRQLATYASYHRNARNRATHFVGIPLIVFSLFIPLAWIDFDLAGMSISVGMIVGLAVLALWIALDWAIGLAMILVLVPMWYFGERIAAAGLGTGWVVFALAFIGGWVFQLVGHVFEGKRPALVDNLFQSLIGPMFLMAEIFVWLGLRRHETIAGAH
jgi:uncharacterized membrane protein YGL010W